MSTISLKTQPRWYGDIATLIYGALLVLAFSPFNLFILSFIAPTLLLVLWINATPSRAFIRGWLFGIGLFGAGSSWVYVSLHVYGQANVLVAGGLTLGLILLMAVFPAVIGYLLARFFPGNNLSKYILVFPALWVLLEWVRTWFLTGFPWLLLGYSQINSPLRGFAPVLSVFGVSWAAVLTSSLIFILILTRRFKIIFYCLLLLILLWTTAYRLNTFVWTKPNNQAIQVSLIQGDIPQEIKWQAKQAEDSFDLYKNLTAKNLKSQLIIWPEAAITLSPEEVPSHIAELNQLLKPRRIALITGIPLVENGNYYNAMIAIGAGNGSYRKRHLVPFGEYMPLRSLLEWLDHYLLIPMSDFSRGAKNQPPMTVHGIPISGSICYEIAFPTETREGLHESQIVIVVSDDSWFGESIAPAQHTQMAQMRALETGRYVLMGTNNAITAIIDSRGKVQAFAPPFQQAVLTGKVQPMVGSTPWVRMGIYPILFGLLLLVIIGWLLQRIRKDYTA